MYSHRLKPEDYEELLKFNTIADIVAYLKKNDKYKNTLSEVYENDLHRGQLEDLIKKSYFFNVAKIVSFISTNDRKFYELDMIKREIEIVLSSLRSIISGNIEKSIRDLPMFFKKHASFDIEEVTKSLTFRDLLYALKDTRYYDILRHYYQENPTLIKYTDIEHEMMAKYHSIVIKRIDKYFTGKTRRRLMDIYQTKVEIDNVIKIYRLKKFYDSPEEEIWKALITEDIRMSKKQLEELIKLKDPNDVLLQMENSQYSDFIDEEDYVYIEYQAERIKYHIAKRYMYFSSVPAIVYTVFIFLNEIEQANIFNIIEGIRYDIDKRDIKRMLIY
ncbi:MAG: V-type ATPase subunit [Candidatus Izimaplasma sp.]|nr:V-type ATPase subunit [Candidatus Izimaplasma bacterium]